MSLWQTSLIIPSFFFPTDSGRRLIFLLNPVLYAAIINRPQMKSTCSFPHAQCLDTPWWLCCSLFPALSLLSINYWVLLVILTSLIPLNFQNNLERYINSALEGSSNHLKVTQLLCITAGGTNSGSLMPKLMLLNLFCIASLLSPVQRAPPLWNFSCTLQGKFVTSSLEMAKVFVHLHYSMALYFNDLNIVFFELLCGRNYVFTYIYLRIPGD